MKISLISYAFHQLTRQGMMDAFGYLETVKYRYHLDYADLWNGTLASTDPEYLAKVKEALEERELGLANLAVDGAHIWEDDPDAREANYQKALAHLKAGELLGAKTIRIDAGGPRDSLKFTPEQFDHIVMRYKEFAQRAYDNGYKVGPENHWGPEAAPEEMVRLIEAVDSPAFGVLLHAGRWYGDNAEQGDAMVVNSVMHTHLTNALSDEKLEATMAMIRDAGYDGIWGVETVGSYFQVGVQLARVAAVLDKWRAES